MKKFKGIDILVNNAGILKFGKLDNIEPSFWDTLMGTNAYAPWRFMVAVLPEMRKAGSGSIMDISSINEIKAFPGAGLYCASKAAQQMLSQVMAMEIAGENIRINSILPGLMEDTDFRHDEIGKRGVCIYAKNPSYRLYRSLVR